MTQRFGRFPGWAIVLRTAFLLTLVEAQAAAMPRITAGCGRPGEVISVEGFDFQPGGYPGVWSLGRSTERQPEVASAVKA